MLEEHLDQEKYDEIVERSSLPIIEITQYAQELLDAISVSNWPYFDLIDSPNNLLKQVTGERTASIHTIIYVMNQLFISNNDLVALDWIENEYCKTGRKFSGGSKINTTMNKEAYDISKLYSNMVSIIADLPNNIPKTMLH